MKWEEVNGKWVLRSADGDGPLASIVKAPSSSGTDKGWWATANYGGDGRVMRAVIPTTDEAKAWCEDRVAGKPEPAKDLWGKVRAPKSKPKALPAGTPLERLLAVLRKDPNLAWELATTLKVLGPWDSVNRRGTVWIRKHPWGAWGPLHVERRDDLTWFYRRVFEGGRDSEDVGTFATMEEAMIVSDDLNRQAGWILVGGLPERVLGPWVKVGDDWWQRATPYGFNVATVREEHSWLWSEFRPDTDSGGEEVRNGRGFGTAEEAMTACDGHLTSLGWVLVSGAVVADP